MEDTTVRHCLVCERELGMGVDVISRQVGVIGPRGFVALEEPELFCSEDCEERHCSEVAGDRRTMPRRIP